MGLLDQLGIALGLATLSGLNLYLTVMVVGLALRFGWVELAAAHNELMALADERVIAVATALFVIEFIADKIPWFDSVWDGIHALIRPAGGVVLALAALGEMNPVWLVIAALLAGTATMSTHGTKAGLRAMINLSPEPVSNTAASVTEDALVLGGLALTAWFPVLAFFVFLIVVIVCSAIAFSLWRALLRLRRSRRKPAAGA